MSSIPISFAEINQIRIAEAVAGEGEPIVMLHGWGANIELVWELARRLVDLQYRVYVPDMPGFGKSADPPSAWSVFDYAEFILSYLDHHQLDQVYLFGHSFGGRLGLVLGAEHGERIHKIVLADSAGVQTSPPLSSQVRLALYKVIRNSLYRIRAKNIADQLQAWYSNRYGSADYQDVSGVMRETFVKVVNEDLLPYAARVQPSTLLFWGDHDEDTPLWQGQLLEKTIPDAGLVIHEGAGHYSYLEHPANTAEVMDYFFKQSPTDKNSML